ncbi:MAG: nucleotide-binding protein [Dysgonamonadaceae bacterium]|jgi:predicted nucleotide-binding protein|nr:nucleotide-binding protein [Dysgonamonadaceae bacterium]
MKKIFIGSSKQSLNIANAVQRSLKSVLGRGFSIKVWNQNVFPLSETFIETLCLAANEEYDFAIFIFSPDDIKVFDDKEFFEARSNVIFEYGLFTGTLNRNKVFVVSPSDCENFIIPSDISGATFAQYEHKKTIGANDVQLKEIVQSACLAIKLAIKKRQTE